METNPTGPDDQPLARAKAAANWRFPLLLACVLAVIFVSRVVQSPAPPPETISNAGPLVPAVLPTGETIALEIDFGNGTRWSFAAVPWTEGMTVETALRQVAVFSPGAPFAQTGVGAAALVTSIAGVENEGLEGRNWLVTVNSEYIQQSMGLQALAPGDVVQWRFTRGSLDE